jgi:hypothetical protein
MVEKQSHGAKAEAGYRTGSEWANNAMRGCTVRRGCAATEGGEGERVEGEGGGGGGGGGGRFVED